MNPNEDIKRINASVHQPTRIFLESGRIHFYDGSDIMFSVRSDSELFYDPDQALFAIVTQASQLQKPLFFLIDDLTEIDNDGTATSYTPPADSTENPAKSRAIYKQLAEEIFFSGSGGGAGVTDHGALSGLSDDDHSQYSIISSGSGAPGSTPPRAGAVYVDTSAGNIYVSKGVASSADWVQVNNTGGGAITILKSAQDSSDVTGTTAETQIYSGILISAGTLSADSVIQVRLRCQKDDASDVFYIRASINTADNLSGATVIGRNSTTGRLCAFKRDCYIKSNTDIQNFNTATSLDSDDDTLAAGPTTNSGFDFANNDYYIVMSIELSNSGDTARGLGYVVEVMP